MSDAPAIGFISPPGWIDPSPGEFPSVCAQTARTQQVPLRAPGFDWRIESVAGLEAETTVAAATLADMGCAVAAATGTPFAWVGTGGLDGARARQARIAEAAGLPVVMAGLAIIGALQALGVGKVALACTYYSTSWRERWAGFVTGAGFEVGAATLAEQGVWSDHGDEERAYWYPTGEDIAENVRRLLADTPGAEAAAITGAGARTLHLIGALEAETGLPVMGADTALYRAAARAADMPLKPGALGRIGEV